jgi:hypothetical protein
MAFLRFTRDKRGYEHFQLVQPVTNRRGSGRSRILYWFRSPPNVRVGREPFDESARIALEQQNPDVAFDWPQILATPTPSGDVERWRERRRREREARQFADEDASADAVEADQPVPEPLPDDPPEALPTENLEQVAQPALTTAGNRVPEGAVAKRRRRRRRGRPRRPHAVAAGEPGGGAGEPPTPATRSDPPSDV